MHDIGKIGTPDYVLLKPGKLNPDEWEIMKQHVTMGAEILGDHPDELLAMARTVALSHHEKWDGTGYPLGLKGPEIPQSGANSSAWLMCLMRSHPSARTRRLGLSKRQFKLLRMGPASTLILR